MDVINVTEYGLIAGTQGNVAINQLIINFLAEEIILIGPPIAMEDWYTVTSKRDLLERCYLTHEFGFINYGSGFINDLVDNAEFLRYVLAKLKEILPMAMSSVTDKESLHHTIITQYVGPDDNLYTLPLHYEHKFENNTPLLHAFDLLGIKSIVFKILHEFHNYGITFANINTPYYKALLEQKLQESENEEELEDETV